MTTEWAHLPNAAHIDRVLADVTRRPEVWGGKRSAARDAARDAAWDAAWDAACRAAGGAARGLAWSAVWKASGGAAWDAIAALIAWDDCAALLDTDPDALRLLAASGHHPAVLLLPACIALKTT